MLLSAVCMSITVADCTRNWNEWLTDVIVQTRSSASARCSLWRVHQGYLLNNNAQMEQNKMRAKRVELRLFLTTFIDLCRSAVYVLLSLITDCVGFVVWRRDMSLSALVSCKLFPWWWVYFLTSLWPLIFCLIRHPVVAAGDVLNMGFIELEWS